MKKVLLTLSVAGMFAFYACGPSAEEKAAQYTKDSLQTADSLKAAMDAANAIQANTMVDTTARMMDTTIAR